MSWNLDGREAAKAPIIRRMFFRVGLCSVEDVKYLVKKCLVAGAHTPCEQEHSQANPFWTLLAESCESLVRGIFGGSNGKFRLLHLEHLKGMEFQSTANNIIYY